MSHFASYMHMYCQWADGIRPNGLRLRGTWVLWKRRLGRKILENIGKCIGAIHSIIHTVLVPPIYPESFVHVYTMVKNQGLQSEALILSVDRIVKWTSCSCGRHISLKNQDFGRDLRGDNLKLTFHPCHDYKVSRGRSPAVGLKLPSPTQRPHLYDIDS